MNQPEFRFRFGLRSMIVGLTVLGVGTGLLGQLYFSNFQAFVAITSVIFTVLPFLLAVGTLVRLGIKSKQPTLILWGVLLFVTPIVGLGLLAVLQSMSGPYGDGMGLLSNKRLIQERIAKDADTPGLWRELERRLHAGSLTNQEVDEAVGQLVSYMKKKRPNGWNQPLNWQDDFLRAAREADAISDASLSGNIVTAGGQMIDPLVRAANVVLQPNVEHIRNGLRNNRQHEGIEDIHEVWGKPIVFPDVPFERLDLEIGQIATEAE